MSSPNLADTDSKIELVLTQASSDEEVAKDQDDSVSEVQSEKAISDVRRRRKYVILMGILTAIIVLGVIFTVYFVLSKNEASSRTTGSSLVAGDDSNVSDGPTVGPTVGAAVPVPTQPPMKNKPTAEPVADPTSPPVVPPTAAPVPDPTAAPAAAPIATAAPVSERAAFINLVVEAAVVDPATLSDSSSPQYLAREWMTTVDNAIWTSQEDMYLTTQRFALAVMDYALGGLQARLATLDTCDWYGITCEPVLDEESLQLKQSVTKIEWARRSLTGTLPAEISLLRTSLSRLDMAENNMTGPIPTEFYSLSNMTHVYLHNNQLTGSISEAGIVLMPQLVEVFLGHNELTGTIPSTWASGQQGASSKPLRYLVLHHNKLSGPIPTNLNWDRMFYMDLGNNQLTGSFPADIEGWWDLRHLYLNSNQLTGSLPSTFGTGAGNGRLIELDISDNQLTGVFPGDWGAMRTLVYMDIKGNGFSAIENTLCKMQVLDSGEIVELQADCDVCPCNACKVFC